MSGFLGKVINGFFLSFVLMVTSQAIAGIDGLENDFYDIKCVDSGKQLLISFSNDPRIWIDSVTFDGEQAESTEVREDKDYLYVTFDPKGLFSFERTVSFSKTTVRTQARFDGYSGKKRFSCLIYNDTYTSIVRSKIFNIRWHAGNDQNGYLQQNCRELKNLMDDQIFHDVSPSAQEEARKVFAVYCTQKQK